MDQKAKLQQNELHAAKTGFLYNITQQACRHDQELEQDALAMDQEKAKLQQDALAIACSQNSLLQALVTTLHSNCAGTIRSWNRML